jgi:hypothetical protein
LGKKCVSSGGRAPLSFTGCKGQEIIQGWHAKMLKGEETVKGFHPTKGIFSILPIGMKILLTSKDILSFIDGRGSNNQVSIR